MALFHFSVTQVKRSAGQSAIAAAAYRAGEKLYSEYYGEFSDYTRKGRVVHADICCDHAPGPIKTVRCYGMLWRRLRKTKKAQLAYSFDIAGMSLAGMKTYLVHSSLTEQLLSRGMIVDYAIHDGHRDRHSQPAFPCAAPSGR